MRQRGNPFGAQKEDAPFACSTKLGARHNYTMGATSPLPDSHQLAEHIKQWCAELGSSRQSPTPMLSEADTDLLYWLEPDRHGEMGYMAAHDTRRNRPVELVPSTARIISARLDYLPEGADGETILQDGCLDTSRAMRWGVTTTGSCAGDESRTGENWGSVLAS